MTRCWVCDRPERTGIARILRGPGLFEHVKMTPAGKSFFVCEAPLCREIAAEAGDLLDTIFATATGGTR